MMKKFNVSEHELSEQREIPTPIRKTLNWDYYCYVKKNPVGKWNAPTAILYGSEDNLTEREVVDNFSKRFDCELTILENGEHWFHTERQLIFLDQWLDEYI